MMYKITIIKQEVQYNAKNYFRHAHLKVGMEFEVVGMLTYLIRDYTIFYG